MSAIKTILKLTPLHCVVKVSDAGSQTISLVNDLKWSNSSTGQAESISPAELPTVNIIGIAFSIPGVTAGSVVRNNIHIWDPIGAYQMHFNGFSDTQQNEGDITVTIPAGGGQIILELVKTAGYNNNQQSNAQPQL